MGSMLVALSHYGTGCVFHTRDQGVQYPFVSSLFACAFAEFCCNGTVVEDTELGQVIQLQGDQRKNVSGFLIANKLAKKVSS